MATCRKHSPPCAAPPTSGAVTQTQHSHFCLVSTVTQCFDPIQVVQRKRSETVPKSDRLLDVVCFLKEFLHILVQLGVECCAIATHSRIVLERGTDGGTQTNTVIELIPEVEFECIGLPGSQNDNGDTGHPPCASPHRSTVSFARFDPKSIRAVNVQWTVARNALSERKSQAQAKKGGSHRAIAVPCGSPPTLFYVGLSWSKFNHMWWEHRMLIYSCRTGSPCKSREIPASVVSAAQEGRRDVSQYKSEALLTAMPCLRRLPRWRKAHHMQATINWRGGPRWGYE
ncbi:hypothetical protein AB1N83_007984 [Pleurotus pulmonarius]